MVVGVVKGSEGTGRYLGWKVQKPGLPLLFLRFFSEVKALVTKSPSGSSSGEWWTQQLGKLKMLAALRVGCSRAFLFVRKTPGWF